MLAHDGTPRHFRGILFDLDGVLVDSRRCVEIVWNAWAADRGLDPVPFLRIAHGRKISETLRLLAPRLDIRAEAAALEALDSTETRGIEVVPGASDLLDSLPEKIWGIVTSGSRAVATLRLTSCGLPIHRLLITGEDVPRGKPDPLPYLEGARRLGVAPADILVIEDAPPGVAAAKAAGMQVIAVATTYPRGDLTEADAIVASLSAIRIRPNSSVDGGLAVDWPRPM